MHVACLLHPIVPMLAFSGNNVLEPQSPSVLQHSLTPYPIDFQNTLPCYEVEVFLWLLAVNMSSLYALLKFGSIEVNAIDLSCSGQFSNPNAVRPDNIRKALSRTQKH